MNNIQIWEKFARHIKSERRYFVDNSEKDIVAILARFDVTLKKLGTEIQPNYRMFRARIHEGEATRPFPSSELGSPPKESAIPGRANPAGIPYLYLASDHETAIAEVRGWKGRFVSVGTFVTTGTLMMIDVTQPFFCKIRNNPNCPYDKVDLLLLDGFALELMKPVSGSQTDVEYAPTQFLAEFIRNKGFDGIRYPSAMGPGNNTVLFNTSNVTVDDNVDLYKLVDVKYSTEPVKLTSD